MQSIALTLRYYTSIFRPATLTLLKTLKNYTVLKYSATIVGSENKFVVINIYLIIKLL